MAIALLVIRIALAAMFAVAAVAKLFSFRSTVTAAVGFGVPRRVAPAVAVLLPVVEFAIAVTLIGRTEARVASVAAAALLAAFLLVTSIAVARGRVISCNCFGSLSNTQVSARTVLRNAALLALAAPTGVLTAAASAPRGVAYGDFGALAWTVFGLVIIVVVLAAAFWRTTLLLLEQHGRLLARLDALTGNQPPAAVDQGLPVGTPAPDFVLEAVSGSQTSLADVTAAGRPVLIVFSDPGCGPCAELMPAVAHWQRDHGDRLTTLVAASGGRDANSTKAAEHGLRSVLWDAGGDVARAYRSPGTPSAVLINPDGTVAAPLAVGAPGIKALAARVTEIPPPAPTIVGTPAPAFALPDAEGGVITQEYLRQHESTVVLFWNSGCGFCQRMRSRLHQWDLEAFGGDRALLVVSSDAPDSADALRLNAPVLHDDGSVMRAFGVSGTPIGVLVDSTATIRSEPAPGEQAVFDLLGAAADPGRSQLPVVPGGRR